MVLWDRRDEFETSEAHLPTVAAEAHRLFESDAFRSDVLDALTPVLQHHLDSAAVDEAAEDVLGEWLYNDGKGGLFQLRNQIVTNREADIAEGDVLHMVSARSTSDEVIPYFVRTAEPDATGVRVWDIRNDPGNWWTTTHHAGLIRHCERFTVEQTYRGDGSHATALTAYEDLVANTMSEDECETPTEVETHE